MCFLFISFERSKETNQRKIFRLEKTFINDLVLREKFKLDLRSQTTNFSFNNNQI